MHDNIVPKPDLALELGKSISLTEAEEEAVAREVHATHARIVSGPDPEPMQEDQTGSNSGKLHVSLAGPNPEHMDDEFLATAYPKVHENLKLITDERVIEENPESHSGSMSSMKNLDDTYNFGDQFLYDKPTEYYNLPPRTVSPDPVAIVASRAVDPVGSPSSTTIDQDEQSTSTSPTNQEIQSQVTHQGPVPQFMAPDHSSSGPVLHEMMSDHNSSVLAPQRQEMSVENVSSGLVPQGQKASDYDNSDPVPPRQNVVPTAEKTDSSQQGLEFLFSPLLEEYYNPTHGQAEENNNNQAPNASFQEDEFINPFCTRVQEIGESSSRNIDNTDVHSFQPQSHDYRWTRDHPLEQVRGNPTMPVQTR
ncbi:hypothetical protein Tco_0384959 [Tanacetum coccineum]